MPLVGAGPHPPAGRRLTVAASGLMPGGRAARDEDGIYEGCVATFKKRQESDGSGRAGAVSCNHPEQLVDELNLSPTIRTAHPPRLPLPDHVHGLVALDRSPRRVECTKALLRCYASFDRSMILLHDVVQVLVRRRGPTRRVSGAAGAHESELARTGPDPQFLHRPMRYDIGLPSPVI